MKAYNTLFIGYDESDNDNAVLTVMVRVSDTRATILNTIVGDKATSLYAELTNQNNPKQ